MALGWVDDVMSGLDVEELKDMYCEVSVVMSEGAIREDNRGNEHRPGRARVITMMSRHGREP